MPSHFRHYGTMRVALAHSVLASPDTPWRAFENAASALLRERLLDGNMRWKNRIRTTLYTTIVPLQLTLLMLTRWRSFTGLVLIAVVPALAVALRATAECLIDIGAALRPRLLPVSAVLHAISSYGGIDDVPAAWARSLPNYLAVATTERSRLSAARRRELNRVQQVWDTAHADLDGEQNEIAWLLAGEFDGTLGELLHVARSV